MKIVPIQCPSCGAKLKVDEDRKFIFCEYCGTQIFIDDEVQRIEHHEYDEARIEEIRSERAIREQHMKSERSMSRIKTIAACLVFALFILVLFFFFKDNAFKEFKMSIDVEYFLIILAMITSLIISEITKK